MNIEHVIERLKNHSTCTTVRQVFVKEDILALIEEIERLQEAVKPAEKVCRWKHGNSGCENNHYSYWFMQNKPYCPDCSGRIEVAMK